MNTPLFHSKANYDHIALVLAERLRRRTDRERLDDGFRIASCLVDEPATDVGED